MIFKSQATATLGYYIMNRPYPKLNSERLNDLQFDLYTENNLKVYLILDGSDKSPIAKRILNQVTGSYLQGSFDQ